MELLSKETMRSPIFFHIPFFVASMIGTLLGWLPGAPITYDQVEMLKSDNVVSANAEKENRTLEGIGISPKPMEAVLPTYMVQYRPHGQFTDKNQAKL